MTNLTNYNPLNGPASLNMPSSCSNTPHYGMVALVYYSGTLKDAVFQSINNTTTASNLSAHEHDMTVTVQGAYGTSLLVQYREQVNFNNTSAPIRMMPIGDPSGWGTGYAGFWTASGSLAPPVSNPCPVGGSSPQIYIWDGACFEKGYPTNYAHDDNAYYHMLNSVNYVGVGTNNYHVHIGSALVSTLGNGLTAGLVGALIGAWVGFMLGNVAGAIAGAAVGAITTAVLAYYGTLTLVDENGVVWMWMAQSFITAAGNVPWYVAMWGPYAVMAYDASHLGYLRLGSATVWNTVGQLNP